MTVDEHLAEADAIRAVLDLDTQAGLAQLGRALDVWEADVRELRQEIALTG